MQAILCFECSGTGKVPFTKEKGGPICNKCCGHGYLTKRVLLATIGAILDHPNIYMGGPSRPSLKKAEKILDYMKDEWGIEFPNG